MQKNCIIINSTKPELAEGFLLYLGDFYLDHCWSTWSPGCIRGRCRLFLANRWTRASCQSSTRYQPPPSATGMPDSSSGSPPPPSSIHHKILTNGRGAGSSIWSGHQGHTAENLRGRRNWKRQKIRAFVWETTTLWRRVFTIVFH